MNSVPGQVGGVFPLWSTEKAEGVIFLKKIWTLQQIPSEEFIFIFTTPSELFNCKANSTRLMLLLFDSSQHGSPWVIHPPLYSKLLSASHFLSPIFPTCPNLLLCIWKVIMWLKTKIPLHPANAQVTHHQSKICNGKN